MKKYAVLVVSILTLTTSAFSQSVDTTFVLTQSGFVHDNTDFIINYYPGKSKQDLYNQLLDNIENTYSSERKVISEIKDSTITVRAATTLVLLKFVSKQYYKVAYTLRFEFQNEKVKIYAPIIVSINSTEQSNTSLVLNYKEKGANKIPVFNENGNVKYAQPKKNLETYFNNLLFQNLAIKSSINSSESVAEQLKKWKELLDSGAITPEEYNTQKKKLLKEP